MQKADLFVLPSRELPNDIESFGIVYIEDQYFGTPCIGTNTGGISESVGNGGVLIENENIGQLKAYLREFINDEERGDHFLKVPPQRIRDKFTLDRRVKDVEKYISEV
jgi:phosphatidylinositol alpha-1,6-mannosyltransferase